MKHQIDGITRFRRIVWPEIHSLKLELSEHGYAKYSLKQSERVAVVPLPVQDVLPLLFEMGFVHEPISALKKRRDADKTLTAGSFTIRGEQAMELAGVVDVGGAHPMEMQLHVTLFGLEDGTEINAHWEYNWRPWAYKLDITRPLKHYLPHKYGYYSAEEGVAMMQHLLDEHNIDYNQP